MTTMTTDDRSRLWEVTSRTIVYSAIGAALYGILLVAQVPIPGSTVSVRPAFALVPFFGYAFGPIVGFFTGFVGNAIGDQISGWGLLTSWNWSLANGLVGLIAGLAPLYLARLTQRLDPRPRASVAPSPASSPSSSASCSCSPTRSCRASDDRDDPQRRCTSRSIVGDLIGTIILVPILVYAWEPVKDRLGPLDPRATQRGRRMNIAPRYLGRGSWLARRDPRVLILVVFLFIFTVLQVWDGRVVLLLAARDRRRLLPLGVDPVGADPPQLGGRASSFIGLLVSREHARHRRRRPGAARRPGRRPLHHADPRARRSPPSR